jgi:hypothetical protein
VIKPEETFLVRANLMDVDMIVLGFGKRLDLLDILGRIRPTYYHIGNIVFYSCWLIWHTQSLCQMSCSRVPSPLGCSFLSLREEAFSH